MSDSYVEMTKKIDEFAAGDKEISEGLKKILDAAMGRQVEYDKGMVSQIQNSIAQIKKENQNLLDEHEIYKDTLSKFGDVMINMDVRGGGALGQITGRMVSQAFNLQSQRSKLEAEGKNSKRD